MIVMGQKTFNFGPSRIFFLQIFKEHFHLDMGKAKTKIVIIFKISHKIFALVTIIRVISPVYSALSNRV